VLKLTEPIPLAEGSHVEIIVIPSKGHKDSPAELLAKIAALPLEGQSDDFSGRNHDQVLYPPSNPVVG
jgi:predicted DNA-binding antitoxin AbrB/MazE fold protein